MESGIPKDVANQAFKDGLADVVGDSFFGKIFADPYYYAVTTFGDKYYQGDKNYPTLEAPPDLERQHEIEISVIEGAAHEIIEQLGEGVSSDVWYDGSGFGDNVCDAYYEFGGGEGSGGGGGWWHNPNVVPCRPGVALVSAR